jgi:toxin CcdB
MPRFHVYKSPESDGYLLDLQANLLSHLNTRVVVPLMPANSGLKPAKVLNPIFSVEGAPHVMATQFIATVPRHLLHTEVLDLSDQVHVVVGALDCLFQGI